MAYLVPNRHGYLQIRFYWRGKRYSEGMNVRAKKVDGVLVPDEPAKFSQLQKWVDKISREIKAGTFDYLEHFPDGNKAKQFKPAAPPTFRTIAAQWLADKKIELESITTHDNYFGIVNYHLNPVVGDFLLSDFSAKPEVITRKLLERLAVKRSRSNKPDAPDQEGGLTQRSKKSVFVILRAILATQRIDFKIPKFPGATRRRKLAFFPPNERDILLKYIDPFYQPFYEFAFSAGPRPSEQIAIEIDAIDWTYKQLPIFDKIVNGKKGKTKTVVSERTIKLTPEMEAPLRRQMAIRATVDAEHNYLFCRPDGRILDVRYLNRWVWKPAMKKAGLRPRPPISTRHTFATINLSAGRSAAWVAQTMGDNIQTVLRNYFHFLPNIGEPFGEPSSGPKP